MTHTRSRAIKEIQWQMDEVVQEFHDGKVASCNFYKQMISAIQSRSRDPKVRRYMLFQAVTSRLCDHWNESEVSMTRIRQLQQLQRRLDKNNF